MALATRSLGLYVNRLPIIKRGLTTTSEAMSPRKKILLAAAGALGMATAGTVYALENSVSAGDLVLHPVKLKWAHTGWFDTFDVASLRRGYQVYKQVCAACHSLQFIYYRHFIDVFLTEAEAKAEAAEIMVTDGPNDEGKMFERPGKTFDLLPKPYPNVKAGAAANNGAAPPDLSYITSARHGGEDYIFALLTGYQDPPAGVALGEGQAYNPYFAGGALSMAQQLWDEGIEYDDGTPATASQQAKDVVSFLKWCAEPEHDTRKLYAMKTLMFFPFMTFVLIYWKRHVWSIIKSSKTIYRPLPNRLPKEPPAP